MTHVVIILYLPSTAAALAAALTLSLRADERPTVVALYAATALSALWFTSDYLLNTRLAVPLRIPSVIRSAAMVPFLVAVVAVTEILVGTVRARRLRTFARTSCLVLAAATALLFVASKSATGQLFAVTTGAVETYTRAGSYAASLLLFLGLFLLGVLNLVRRKSSQALSLGRWVGLLVVLIPPAFLFDVFVIRMKILTSSGQSRATFPLCFLAFCCWTVLLIVRYRRSIRTQPTFVASRDEDQIAGRLIAARYGLTPREVEVTDRLLAGWSNGDIARALCISPHTVKNHVYSIFRKTGARGRFDLVRLANVARAGGGVSEAPFAH